MIIRKILLSVLALMLLAGPLAVLTGSRDAAAAALKRVAVLKELKGDVKVKKSGGTKAFKAFKKMSLNEGDTLTTGAGASVVLELSSKDADEDTVTIGESSQVDFTKLSDAKGTKSKMNIWAGSMWVKVKSISNAGDTFEIETPTSIMGVRGTQFFVSVSPVTGTQHTAVFAGTVQVTPAGKAREAYYLYPAQNLLVAAGEGNVQSQLSFLGVTDFIKNLSPDLIAKIIQDAANINEENEAMLKKMSEQIGRDVPSTFPVNDADSLERYQHNIDHLIANIAKQAIDKGKFSLEDMKKLVDAVNPGLPDGKKIDLSKVEELKFSEQEKAEMEKAAKLERERLAKMNEERKKAEEARKKQEELRKKLEFEKARQAELNRLEEEALKKAAEEALKKKLTEEEKKRFEDDKKALDPDSGVKPPTGGGGTVITTPDTAAKVILLSPASSGTLTNPAPGTAFNLELQLQGFENARSISGYQVRLEYESGHIEFQYDRFLSDPLPYRQSKGIFDVEPEGASVDDAQSVDFVKHSQSGPDPQRGTVLYAVSKFKGNTVSVRNWTTVVKLPFTVRDLPAGAGSYDVKFRIAEIIAVNADGQPVQNVKIGSELNLKLVKTN